MENPKEPPSRRTSEIEQRSPRRSVEGNAGKSSRLTFELAEDHKEILRQLDLLKVTRKLVRSNSKPTIICIHLQQLFAQHCAREQRFLYPLLSRYLDSNVCKLLTQEHEALSNAMRKAVEQIRGNGKDTYWESMSQLDQMLRSHFSKEENVLFWYLDVQLNPRSSFELPS
ncbi:MAG: hemerythrin domain-containing protein [Candidatus Bathyarchaeia archaeon]